MFTPEGRPVCGRRKKLKNRMIEDEACLAVPMAAGPCKVHGGMSTGAPMRSGGRYSRVLKRWKRPFERALSDREILDSKRELAMMDTQIERLVARAEKADSPTWRAELAAIVYELNQAIRDQRQADVGPLLRQLTESIERGAKADVVRRDLTYELERRVRCSAKLSELELRREQTLTERDLNAVLGSFMRVLQTHLDIEVVRKLVPLLRATMPSPDMIAETREVEMVE
ncbi:MAG: hypothetical protein EPO68_04140 [Planctomycetota bacterium]|nr:MAG: hypothetical protein EPO68_04140 [Planctomycetota bacterium]